MGNHTIIDDLLPINKFTRPGTKNKPGYIVVHWTGNPNTTAKNNRDYFAGYCRKSSIYASAHYTIGLAGEIIRCVPENEIAYHAGGESYTEFAKKAFYDIAHVKVYPHNKCIGIEVCHPDWTGKFTNETYESLVWLVSDIAKRNSISVDKIIRHYDVTGKTCPKWFVDHEDEWGSFKEKVSLLLV